MHRFPACPSRTPAQVLLKSRAVELLLDGCLSKGAFPFEAEPLAALLSSVAHPSVPRDYCQALATAACALGAVSTTDPLAPAPAAKRSAAAALALALKGIPKPPPAKPAEAPAAKLKRLGGELGRQEARLPATSAPKELCKVCICCGLHTVKLLRGGWCPDATELRKVLTGLCDCAGSCFFWTVGCFGSCLPCVLAMVNSRCNLLLCAQHFSFGFKTFRALPYCPSAGVQLHPRAAVQPAGRAAAGRRCRCSTRCSRAGRRPEAAG